MSAEPTLAPLRVLPVPGPRMSPTPLPGQPFPDDYSGSQFVQGALAFDELDLDDEPRQGPPLPDPEKLAAPIAQALVEVLAGRRPVVQMVRWTSPAVYAALTTRAAVAARRRLSGHVGPVRVTVRRVIVTRPKEDVAEVAVVVIDGSRVRAIAFQLLGERGRWTVQALQVG